jgi:hypothetical protein
MMFGTVVTMERWLMCYKQEHLKRQGCHSLITFEKMTISKIMYQYCREICHSKSLFVCVIDLPNSSSGDMSPHDVAGAPVILQEVTKYPPLGLLGSHEPANPPFEFI